MDKKSIADLVYWRLVSVRISAESEAPELYFVLLEGDQDRPLMHDNHIVFFAAPGKARSVIGEFGSEIAVDQISVEEPLYHCDVANLLYVLSSCAIDEEGTVIDTLNLLLDMVRLAPFELPPNYKKILYALADHFTFESDASAFFKEPSAGNRDAIDAVLWCVGMIVSIARVI